MSLDAPLDTRPLIADMKRRAVKDFLARIRPRDLEDAMLLIHDYGTTPAEACLAVLEKWADAEPGAR